MYKFDHRQELMTRSMSKIVIWFGSDLSQKKFRKISLEEKKRENERDKRNEQASEIGSRRDNATYL